MKKMKSPVYKVELLPTGAKDKMGKTNYYLYVNGKTDKAIYTDYPTEMFCSGHKGSFSKRLMDIPCKYFPHKMWSSVEFQAPAPLDEWNEDRYLLIDIKNNKFELGFYLSNDTEYGKTVFL